MLSKAKPVSPDLPHRALHCVRAHRTVVTWYSCMWNRTRLEGWHVPLYIPHIGILQVQLCLVLHSRLTSSLVRHWRVVPQSMTYQRMAYQRPGGALPETC